MLLSTLVYAAVALQGAMAFNPREYTKSKTTCKAVNRSENNAIVDITMTYVDINPTAKDTIIMAHGWPSLWSSWSKQIDLLKDDYRLIVVDHRGFGESTHPGDPKMSGAMFDLVADLACVLEDAQVTQAVCMGHDWGSQMCYEAARSRPDVFTGVVGIAVPYIAAGPTYVPHKALVQHLPKLAYQVFLDEKSEEATAELDKDIRRSARAILRAKPTAPPPAFLTSMDTMLGAWEDVETIPPIPFFTSDEEDYFVEQYSIQGFKNTLQFYSTQNRYLTWTVASEQGNQTIPQPVLAIYPTADPVADWVVASKLLKSADFLPKMTTTLVEGGHWVHIENPEPCNAAIQPWLKEFFAERKETHDEL